MLSTQNNLNTKKNEINKSNFQRQPVQLCNKHK